MRAEVLAWCRREGLLAAGMHVVCAVSGGADSMALLWCLHSLQSELSLTVTAAHFNHCLRGAESDRDEQFVRDFCASHAIPLAVGAEDVASHTNGRTIEETARDLRYAFLLSLPCDCVATAHTADDNAETVLLHLLRGSGLRGLCGIPPKRGKIIRPLLSVTREQLEAFLLEEGIGWVEDSSNSLPDCLRNRLRHQVMPLLRAENPRLSVRLTEQSALLRADDALLDSCASSLLRSALRDADTPLWHCPTLAAAQDALQKRALRLLLRDYLPQDAALTHIRSLQSLLTAPSPSASISLPNGLTALRRYDCLTISRAAPPAFPVTQLKIPGETRIETLGLRILCKFEEKYKNFSNTPFHFAVKYDMISQSILFVRPRRVGDRISTPGGHTTTLKKHFIEQRIPRDLRDRIPVLATNETVLAVGGIGVNPLYSAAAGEPAVIIHIEKEEM